MTTLTLNVLSKTVANAMLAYSTADIVCTESAINKDTSLDRLCSLLCKAYPENTLLYLVSNTTEGSLASPELYADMLVVHDAMLPDAVRALAAIDPATMPTKLPDGSPNPERVAVMNAKKQAASRLKDTRNAVGKRLDKAKREDMSDDEKDIADDTKALTRLRTTYATLGKQFENIANELELKEGGPSYHALGLVIAAMAAEPTEPKH